MTAAAWAYAAACLILAGCCAYAWSVLGGHERPGCLRRAISVRATRVLLTIAIGVLTAVLRVTGAVSGAGVRVRWAWRCRGHPAVTSERDPLDRDDMRAFLGLVAAWRQPAAPERSRT